MEKLDYSAVKDLVEEFTDKLAGQNLVGVIMIGKGGTREVITSYSGYASQVAQLIQVGAQGIYDDLDDVGKAEYQLGQAISLNSRAKHADD